MPNLMGQFGTFHHNLYSCNVYRLSINGLNKTIKLVELDVDPSPVYTFQFLHCHIWKFYII